MENAKALAQNVTKSVAQRQVKRITRGKRVKLELPEISTPSTDLQDLVSSYRNEIQAIYRTAAINAEIQALMRRKLAEEDEDELIAMLMD